jgi:hypothetical protein
MLKYFTRVLRALLVTCLGAGGGVGLMVFIYMVLQHSQRSFQIALQLGLCIGIFCALLLGVVFLLIDLTARLFVAKGVHKEIWQLEQVREITAEGTAKEVVAACRQALLAVPYIKSVSDDMEHMITRATVGQSWRSAGEEMEVEINPKEEKKWQLRCSSKPRSSNMVFDYGKNFENVEAWQREFNAAMVNIKTGTRVY